MPQTNNEEQAQMGFDFASFEPQQQDVQVSNFDFGGFDQPAETNQTEGQSKLAQHGAFTFEQLAQTAEEPEYFLGASYSAAAQMQAEQTNGENHKSVGVEEVEAYDQELKDEM